MYNCAVKIVITYAHYVVYCPLVTLTCVFSTYKYHSLTDVFRAIIVISVTPSQAYSYVRLAILLECVVLYRFVNIILCKCVICYNSGLLVMFMVTISNTGIFIVGGSWN